MDKITVAVPCYNEEPVLELFYKEITVVAAKMPQAEFEFLFIDDGSRDGTLSKILELSNRDSRVKYISFSVISARKREFTQVWKTHPGTMWSSWMRICRILRPCFRKCTGR